jgi:hypothetical protein
MTMNADADKLEATAFQMEQELKPYTDTIKAMREVALNLRRAGKPAPAQ